LSALRGLDNQFTGLFDSGVQPSDDEGTSDDFSAKFMSNYGWIYNTFTVAEFERIELDKAYELPTLQYLNDLSYLKAKASFDAEQVKQYANNSAGAAKSFR